jgi:hypothetical protein
MKWRDAEKWADRSELFARASRTIGMCSMDARSQAQTGRPLRKDATPLEKGKMWAGTDRRWARPRSDGNHMIRRWFTGFMMGVMVLALSDAHAQTGSIVHDPTDMLEKYLELDIKGVRLDAVSQEALAPYITWKDEPIWGRSVVVTSYKFINEFKQWTIIDQSEVIIPVEYTVLGSVYWERASFLPEPKTERVGFRIKIVGDRWRIAEPILPPHIGQKRMINYVRQAILDEKDQAKAATLETLLDDLKKAKHEGPASAQAPR